MRVRRGEDAEYAPHVGMRPSPPTGAATAVQMITLTTKLFIPPPLPNAVLRTALIARLQAGRDRKLTLLAAPAGSGKTSLVASWLHVLTSHRVAWLSLDAADADPARLLSYLVAAVQTVAPTFGADVLALLHAPQPPPIDTALTLLINRLAALPHPTILVLDDAHVLAGEPITQVLGMLVEHLPPQIHLVIITRADPPLPLARLRARGQISEIRAPDLRFTPAEVAAFFTEVMGVPLAAHEIAVLEQRTEGWAVGLQLAALSLQDHPDRASFVRSFSGSHRFVLDYLLDEVLRQQPAAIQQFLLRTAILERLCAPLCDALLAPIAHTQAVYTPAVDLLAQLERANLFLIPLDDERRWYRYHHLFRELLRQRLPLDAGMSAAEIAALHQRASAWFEAHDLLLEALQHAAAADPDWLAALAERSWEQMDSGFQSAAWCAAVRQLPDALLLKRPVLCVQYASALSDTGDLEGSAAWLRAAERWLEPPDRTAAPVIVMAAQFATLPARIALIRAYNAQAQGNVPVAAQQATLALECLDDAPTLLRAQAMALLGLAYWTTGDLAAAQRALAGWIAYTREAGNLAFTLASHVYLVAILLAQGQLREAARLCRQVLEQVPADDTAARLAVPHLHLGLATITYAQGDLLATRQHLQASKAVGEQGALIDWSFRWHLQQARLAEAEGNWIAALDLLDEAERRWVRTPVPDLRPIAALRARLHLRQGNLSAVQAWAAATSLTPADELGYVREYEQCILARLLIAQVSQQETAVELHAVFSLLARLLRAAEAGRRTSSMIEILLIQAQAHITDGDLPQSYRALERALRLAQPEGYVQVFVDEGPLLAHLLARMSIPDALQAYVQTILQAFGHPTPVTAAPLVEPLTLREIEILRLIAAGLSNQEIAAQLHLSPQTIKVHTRNIYGKLGVTSRTQAVAQGRALGMV